MSIYIKNLIKNSNTIRRSIIRITIMSMKNRELESPKLDVTGSIMWSITNNIELKESMATKLWSDDFQIIINCKHRWSIQMRDGSIEKVAY